MKLRTVILLERAHAPLKRMIVAPLLALPTAVAY
jgi:hypothetical protein